MEAKKNGHGGNGHRFISVLVESSLVHRLSPFAFVLGSGPHHNAPAASLTGAFMTQVHLFDKFSYEAGRRRNHSTRFWTVVNHTSSLLLRYMTRSGVQNHASSGPCSLTRVPPPVWNHAMTDPPTPVVRSIPGIVEALSPTAGTNSIGKLKALIPRIGSVICQIVSSTYTKP